MVQAERAHKIKPRDTLNNYLLSDETEDFKNGGNVQVQFHYFECLQIKHFQKSGDGMSKPAWYVAPKNV